jgi:hypothetical protein
MGGEHNLEKKFLHVANDINRNAPKKSKYFPIGRWGGKAIGYILDFHIPPCVPWFPNMLLMCFCPSFLNVLILNGSLIFQMHFLSCSPKYHISSHIFITNLPCFIGLYKFCVKLGFHKFVQKLHEFYVVVNIKDICMYSTSYIFKRIRHFIYLHIWMFMFNTQKTHSFIQNYVMIITHI